MTPSLFGYRLWSAAFLALGLLAPIACNNSGPKLSPVKGQVFYDDKPAEGATVVFQPKDAKQDGVTPSGTVGPDGSFAIRTHPHGEGAPPGEYAVLITWYPENARQAANPKNKLPARYADPAETPFRAIVGNAPVELEPFQIPKN